MNKYIVTTNNHLFCGMDKEYSAIAKSKQEIEDNLPCLAYDDFSDLGGFDDYDEDSDKNEYTLEELDESYYMFVDEYNEEDHYNFDIYELIYDGRIKKD